MSLKIYYRNVDLKVISQLTELKQLSLMTPFITDIGAKALTQLTGLTTLSFDSAQVTDDDLNTLSGLSALQRLTLRNCREITGDGLQALTSLTTLHSLNISRCDHIHDKHLPDFTHLTTLDFSTSGHIGHLAYLTQLQYLRLVGNSNYMTDYNLHDLNTLRQVKTLSLVNCDNITEAGLASLSNLGALESLTLSCNPNLSVAKLWSVFPTLQTIIKNGDKYERQRWPHASAREPVIDDNLFTTPFSQVFKKAEFFE